MATATAAEVIPIAITQEGGVPSSASTAAQELSTAIRKRTAERPDAWRESLDLACHKPVEGVKRKLEEIGTQRHTKGKEQGKKKRPDGSPEKDKHDRGTVATALNEKFLEKGYAGLTTKEKEKIRGRIIAHLKLNPSLAAKIAEAGFNEDALVASILEDPRYASFFREIFGTHASAEPLADSVTAAQDAFDEVDSKRKTNQEAIDDLDEEMKQVDGPLAEFDRSNPQTPGVKAAKIARLERNLSTLQGELVQLDLELQQARTARNTAQDKLKRAIINKQQDTTAEERVLSNAEIEVSQRQQRRDQKKAEIESLPALKAEEARLRADKTPLAERRRALNEEKREIDREWQRRKAQLWDAKDLRETAEEDLVRGFERVWEEATEQWLEDKRDELSRAFDEELAEREEKAKDEREKKVYAALRERHYKTRGKGKIWERRIIRRGQVNADYRTLLSAGPDALLDQVLEDAGYTDDAVRKEIMADKDFVTKMQTEVAKQVVAKKIMTGGIRQEDASIIMNSSWGQGIVEGALANSEQLRSMVNRLSEKGALSRKGFLERFWQVAREHPWIWLLLLTAFVSPALALSAPVVVGALAGTMSPEEEQPMSTVLP